MRLLIIDDEPHIRQMMRLTLAAAGYAVDAAADGQGTGAREACREAQPSASRDALDVTAR